MVAEADGSKTITIPGRPIVRRQGVIARAVSEKTVSEKTIRKNCHRKMIMSYLCKIEMSYAENATLLLFPRRQDGGKGQCHATAEGFEATPCHAQGA
jgi:hypothetical protein